MRRSPSLLAVLVAFAFGVLAPAARAGSLGPCAAADWVLSGTQADGRLGTVAPAGDVNHDGYADVLVGCYNCSHPEINEGVVSLFLGGPAGLPAVPAWTAESNQAVARMGDKLSGAGDVNGDGYDDVVVGAAYYDHDFTDEGAAFLYLGGPGGLAATPAWVTYGGQAGAQYGACAQGAGDVNGDGYADVIIGSWLYSGATHPFEGRARLFLGGPAGLSTTPAWTGEGGSDNEVFGYFATTAGDLNHDGYGDICIGARRFSGAGGTREGRVYVYYGSPAGIPATADWIRDGGQALGEFGASVASAGDVNGDGYGDMVVGAFRQDDPLVDAGAAYLFLGSATGLGPTPAWTVTGRQTGAMDGYHVDTAGDANGDGYGDVIISASMWDEGSFTDAGRAELFLGSPTGLSTVPVWTQPGDQTGGGLGNAVRGVGDVNGDGFGDFGTGALYEDTPAVDAGRAYVFYGCHIPSTAVESAAPRTAVLRVQGANPLHGGGVAFAIELPAAARVRVAVRDVLGRLVATPFAGESAAGVRTLAWDARGPDGRRVPPGVYLVTLEGAGARRAVRLAVLE